MDDHAMNTQHNDMSADVTGTSVLVGKPLTADPSLLPHILDHCTCLGDQTALECGDARLSWQVLGARSAAIAHYLVGQGIGPGSRVLLSSERSVDLICVLLGIMRAGAAYVPVARDTSAHRLEQVCRLLAIDHALIDASVAQPPCPATVIDGPAIDRWQAETSDDALPAISGDSEAYVIFTSGSTGTPLGIPIQHKQLAASTQARASVYAKAPQRFLMLSDLSFDSSVVGIFWTLSTGGTLVLPTPAQRPDIDALIGMFKHGGLSHTLCVPTLYGAILKRAQETGTPGGWPAHVIVAGDHCPTWVCDQHFAMAPQSALSNEFGPTEATVWATVAHYAAGVNDTSVGLPIPGSWVGVIDDDGALAPTGISGELILGGPQITSGYLGDDDANAHRFGVLADIADPFGAPSARYVRTGDRAVISLGRVSLLGRSALQIKLGGRRIDTIEIEDRACQIAGANHAIAVAFDPRDLPQIMADCAPEDVAAALEAANDSPSPETVMRHLLGQAAGTHLELGLILETEHAVDSEAVKRGLADILPRDVAGLHVATLQRFPLSQNEKIDRPTAIVMAMDDLLAPPVKPTEPEAALPATQSDDAVASAPLEQTILSLFRTELRAPSMTATQSFFEAGGHSLKALTVLMQIEKATGLNLSTTVIYENPTAAGLAQALGGAPTPTEPPAALAVSPEGPVTGLSEDDDEPETVIVQGREIKARPLPVSGGFRSLTIPLQSGGTRPPIIAIHNIGEGASFFAELAAELGPEQPFICLGKPIEYKTIYRYEDMLDGDFNIEAICRTYADEIERLVPEGPFIITALCGGVPFGHSTALEMASRGRMAALNVMMADWHAPNLRLAEESKAKQIWKHRWNQIRREKMDLVRTFSKRAPASLKLRKKLIERQIEILTLRSYEKRGKELTPRLISRKYTEEGLAMLHAFEHLPYDGPSLSIRCEDDPNFWLDGKEQGWTGILSDWDYRKVPGTGFDIVEQPHVKDTAGIFAQAIDQIIDGKHPLHNMQAASEDMTAASKSARTSFAVTAETARASLTLRHTDSIRTPGTHQRAWLLEQMVRELGDEADELARIAPDMIPGGETPVLSGRDTTVLGADDIMEDWQTPLMACMATSVTRGGGDVLEIGYGRGVASAMIQSHNPASHSIVDCNPHILADCATWRANLPGRDIRVIDGMWQDAVPRLGRFDGILFHTYPLSIEELLDNLSRYCTFAEAFFETAAAHLNPGGRFCYFANERDSLSRRHQRSLLKHFGGFEVQHLTDLNIPHDSRDAHWFQDIVCVTAVMRSDS